MHVEANPSSGALGASPGIFGPAHGLAVPPAQPDPRIRSLDVHYELIAHDFAYKDQDVVDGDWGNPTPERTLLERWGYTAIEVVQGSRSFAFSVVLPRLGSGANPVVAFRGTESMLGDDGRMDAWDWLGLPGNLGVGHTQYHTGQNRELAEAAISRAAAVSETGRVDLVGHSLGGGLAQIASIRMMDRVQRVMTFQSPQLNRAGVAAHAAAHARCLEAGLPVPHYTHHYIRGDPVAGTAGSVVAAWTGMRGLLGVGRGQTRVFQHQQPSEWNLLRRHNNFLLQGDTQPVPRTGVGPALVRDLGFNAALQLCPRRAPSPAMVQYWVQEYQRRWAVPWGPLKVGRTYGADDG